MVYTPTPFGLDFIIFVPRDLWTHTGSPLQLDRPFRGHFPNLYADEQVEGWRQTSVGLINENGHGLGLHLIGWNSAEITCFTQRVLEEEDGVIPAWKAAAITVTQTQRDQVASAGNVFHLDEEGVFDS